VRALITGGKGFVGRHLEAHLRAAGDEVVVVDIDCDVTDLGSVQAAVDQARPDHIYHLAALAHVGDSWRDPSRVLEVNVVGTANVLSAARGHDEATGVLVVSSAEVYGVVSPDQLPLDEATPVAPVTPYAASKAAAEQVALQAARGYGQNVAVVRPFNHIGPGQAASFAVPGFARRIVAARRAGDSSLVVGNLEPRRDFTDVRDVVAAYRLLACSGAKGEVYNVASGVDVAMAEVVETLERLAGVELDLVVDAELLRPVDIPVLRGDATKLHDATGWVPAISLEQSLSDVLADAQA
jgi:GDP-4-dehydro-6-deoxy-D-mannose reductase